MMNYDPTTTPISGHSYPHALTAAGSTVHAYRSWIDPGDTSGDWLACVTLPDGRTGWVHDYCCNTDDDMFETDVGRPSELSDDYLARLARFGRMLLIFEVESPSQTEEGIGWCTETGQVDDMLAFVRQVSAEVGLPPPPADDGE